MKRHIDLISSFHHKITWLLAQHVTMTAPCINKFLNKGNFIYDLSTNHAKLVLYCLLTAAKQAYMFYSLI